MRLRAVDRGSHLRGFCSLELLLALGLSVLLVAALLTLTVDFLTFEQAFSVLVRRGEGLQTVASLLNRYAAGAGNRQDRGLGLQVAADSLRVLSDQDGPDGFPDGVLAAPFESIRVRVSQGALQVRSGRGGYQTIVLGIEGLQVAHPEPRMLRINVSTVTELVPRLVHAVGGAELEFDIFLWNYRPQLFLPGGEPGGGE